MNSTITKFADHEKKINKGAGIELEGWFDAYAECKAMIKRGVVKNVQEYATRAAKVSKSHKFNSINQYLGHIKWADDNGYKCSDFTSVGHIRETKKPTKKNVKPATKRSAYDEVFSQAKHLSKESRVRLIAKLLKTV